MGTGPGKHARKTPRTTTISLTISFAVAFAAIVTALLMRTVDTTDAASAPAPAPAPVASTVEPVMQEGRITAVSPTSLTAQGPDGVTRTFLVDEQTHGITPAGSQLGATATAFSVNDEVSIIGVARGGDKVATTVVHREATGVNGPPMDYALP